MNRCIGCGIILQETNEKELGFRLNSTQKYCQRCFKITNYNYNPNHVVLEFDNHSIIDKLQQFNGTYLWLVDLFDFEANLFKEFAKLFVNKKVIMIVTKRDIIDHNVNNQKLMLAIHKRLKQFGITVNASFMMAYNHLNPYLDDLIELLNDFDEQYLFMGMVNSGKSTLINSLLSSKVLTSSYYPVTTLQISEIVQDQYNFKIFDSPGLVNKNALTTLVSISQLKKIVPNKLIKTINFQLNKYQEISIDNFFSLQVDQKVNISCYFANSLNLHRSHQKNNYFQSLEIKDGVYQEIQEFKEIELNLGFKNNDIVFVGLGFICVHDFKGKVRITCHKNLKVIVREAFI